MHFIAVARRFMQVDMPQPLRTPRNSNQSPDLLPYLLHAFVRLLAECEGEQAGPLLATCALCGLFAEWLLKKRHPDLAFRKTRAMHAADAVCTVYHLLQTSLAPNRRRILAQPALRLVGYLARTAADELLAIPLDIVPAPSSVYIPDPAGFDDDVLPFFEALELDEAGDFDKTKMSPEKLLEV